VKILAWIAALVIVLLNARLVISTIRDWITNTGDASIILWFTVVPLIVGIFILLIYILVTEILAKEKTTMPSEIEQLEFVPQSIHVLELQLI